MKNKNKFIWSAQILSGVRTILLSCCAVFLLSINDVVAAEKQPAGNTFDIALIGDMPYTLRQRKEFKNLMHVLNRQKLAFVLHAGDFSFDGLVWANTLRGLPPCSDRTLQDRLALAQRSRHPFIFTPGDNDWTDCYRAKPRQYDPLERLATLRRLFFSGDRSLGKRTIPLVRQSNNPRYSAYRENVRWIKGDVLFVTLHMVGSNNNRGRTPEMDKEYERRTAANLTWLRDAFRLARKKNLRGILIMAQANPQFETRWTRKQKKRYLLGGLGIKPTDNKRVTGFDSFINMLEKEVVAFGKPVLYVHGDTHTFRVDKPLTGTRTRRFIENFTRVETFGYPDTHWVRITIDTSDPALFRIQPEIVQKNRAR